MYVMCCFHVKFESIFIPRNFVEFTCSISVLLICIFVSCFEEDDVFFIYLKLIYSLAAMPTLFLTRYLVFH